MKPTAKLRFVERVVIVRGSNPMDRDYEVRKSVLQQWWELWSDDGVAVICAEWRDVPVETDETKCQQST